MTTKKRKIRRKLVGFVMGEKGSIGKAQALALGTGALAAIGLEISASKESGDWNDTNPVTKPEPLSIEEIPPVEEEPLSYGDCGWGDWAGDWHNEAPEVEVEGRY